MSRHRCHRHVWIAAAVVTLAGVLSACGTSDDRTVIAIVGDSYSTGVEIGGMGDANWAIRLRDILRRDGYPNRVVVEAGPGSGYVSPGLLGSTFGEMATEVPDDADVVIVFGSVNDAIIGAPTDWVNGAARATFDWLRAHRADAHLVVIGPSPVGDELPTGLQDVSTAVLDEARRIDATIIDPIADRWFMGKASALISDDELHPTDAGHRYIARKVAPVVENVIGAAGRTSQP